jgi:hypothetical protein
MVQGRAHAAFLRMTSPLQDAVQAIPGNQLNIQKD